MPMNRPKTPSLPPAVPAHSPEDVAAVRRLLAYIGEDPDREGLLETPVRFLKAWEEYTRGYRMNPEEILKSFEDGAQAVDEMVIVRDIPVYSLGEHHLAPFVGKAYVGYVPRKRILGLSKISRLVEIYGRRLQVQERLTNQIADALDTHLKPLGVAVVIECRHMCMESRGVRHTGTATVTSALRGSIKANADTRREFLSLIGR
ncbi:MAG: GTP cyclohydrolase I FolE [Gammaproteobacteria bacterium]